MKQKCLIQRGAPRQKMEHKMEVQNICEVGISTGLLMLTTFVWRILSNLPLLYTSISSTSRVFSRGTWQSSVLHFTNREPVVYINILLMTAPISGCYSLPGADSAHDLSKKWNGDFTAGIKAPVWAYIVNSRVQFHQLRYTAHIYGRAPCGAGSC